MQILFLGFSFTNNVQDTPIERHRSQKALSQAVEDKRDYGVCVSTWKEINKRNDTERANRRFATVPN